MNGTYTHALTIRWNKMFQVVRFGAFSAIPIALIGCGGGGGGVQTSSIASVELAPFDVNRYKMEKTVCDPLTQAPQETLYNGIKGELYYRGATQPRWYDVQSYLDLGIKSDRELFFSVINVPTRLFNNGFPSQTGSMLKNDAGQDLIEYFGLKFTGRITLDSCDEPGQYELAMLSDDGAIWRMGPDGAQTVVVSNDGDHPTRLACGQTISMAAGELKEFDIRYYQGPRHHISLIPLWRRVTDTTIAETLCGQTGNDLFFDFNNNSAPKPAYNQLLARGWKPLTANNFILPKTDTHNPCAESGAPVITNVISEFDVDGGLEVSWQTDIPATSHLMIKDMATGIERSTTSDNILRTSHFVLEFNLPAGNYQIRAVSISTTNGKALSSPFTVTVP